MKVIQIIKLAFISALLLSLTACNNVGTTANDLNVAKASTPAANSAPVKATPAAMKTTASVRPAQAKSRPASEIDMNFPYDVTLMDADGNKVNSKEILGNGKPTAVLFWLTTCGPCKMKFSAIDKKYAKWKEETDFNMVAISVDWPKNTQKFRDMVKEKDWPWPVYHDFGMEFKKIMPGNLNGLPQEFLFDKNGELVYHKKRYTMGAEDILYRKIQELAE